MRLIDADKLIGVFSEKKEVWRGNGVLPSNESLMWLAAMDITSNAPTVDAVPVVHGRWEGGETCEAYDIAGVKTWAIKCKCSVCGFVHKFIEAHMCYEFCPNCGAKMDLEEQDAKEET